MRADDTAVGAGEQERAAGVEADAVVPPGADEDLAEPVAGDVPDAARPEPEPGPAGADEVVQLGPVGAGAGRIDQVAIRLRFRIVTLDT